MRRVRTGDQALVRDINLSIVLHALRDHAPVTRASLAAITGLNKTTVSSLVQQLIDARFVSEIGAGKTEDVGRPGIMLQPNPGAGYIIGAEIGVDFISVVVTDFAAEIVWRHGERTGYRHDRETVLPRTVEIVREAINYIGAGHTGDGHTGDGRADILGIGLGVPGLVDVASGTLLFGPNLRWRDVPLRRMLQAEFDFPVYVDNEANMAALGETYFGVARGARSVLYVSAGVGLGGGIVLDGRLLPGASGYVGELGHMTMVLDGLPCNCGNRGCWETVVSQAAVFRRIREAVASGQRTRLTELTGGGLDALTVPLVVEAARAGDGVALRALDETGVYLGVGIANLVNALNPEAVVFGGILSLAGEFLMPVVEQVIRERALRWSAESMAVSVAAHGADACVMGGIATVYHNILSQPSGSVRSNGKRQSATTVIGVEPRRRALAARE